MSERKSKKKAGAGAAGNGGSGGSPSAGGGGPMDVSLLQQIVKLMAANDLSTVDLRDGGRRIVLKRGADIVAMPTPTASPFPQVQPTATPQSTSSSQPSSPVAEDDTKGLVPIKSPMVGTFYASSKPGEKPFVTVGAPVNEESDVCIIEAMKTFNVHKAGVSGTIARVLVQDGQTVQFDQPLFLVKPWRPGGNFTMTQRRSLSFSTFDEIAEDVRRLRRDDYVQAGQWSLPQACHHLNKSLEWSMRAGPFPPDTPEQQASKPRLEQILRSGRLPDGLQAPDHMQPPPGADDVAVDTFLDTLKRYERHQGELAPHRLFGRQSRDVIHQLVRIHCAHHLSHLVPAANAGSNA